eukprot:9928456-Lingulodinium_polyedra.AAC.1
MGLAQTAKMQCLQDQFVQAGTTFIGIQEARTKGPELRPMASFTAISSGCTAAGTHGCELWFRTGVPVYVDGCAIHLTPDCFT